MVFQNNLLAGVGGQGGAAAYDIPYSCRFNDNDSAYLQFTPTTSSAARKTFTVSAWYKRGNLGLAQPTIIGAADAGATVYTYLLTAAYDANDFIGSSAVPSGFVFLADISLRDPSAWYHAVIAVDTTQVSASDRWTFYLNGKRIPFVTTNQLPALNYETPMNYASYPIAIGRLGAWTGAAYMDGYVSQVAHVSELALAPTDFGEFDDNGVWRPIDITGLDYSGENSFLLDFADSSDLGNDVSGNDNDFTSSGLAATDQMTDTPTTNFSTMSPINKGGNIALSNGNLHIEDGTNEDAMGTGTIAVSSGKWYWEYTVDTTAADAHGMGVAETVLAPLAAGFTGTSSVWAYQAGNGNSCNGSSVSYGDSVSTTEVMGIALDLDNGAVWWSNENVWQASATIEEIAAGTTTNAAYTNLSGKTVTPLIGFGSSSTPGGTFNFGQQAFAGTAPTGFNKLNTANLPEPTIKNSKKYFDTILYEGNGTGQKVGQFQPMTETYSVGNSALFIEDDDCFLSRTPGSAGNRATWTFSTWFKRCELTTSVDMTFFAAYGANSDEGYLTCGIYNNTDQIYIEAWSAMLRNSTRQFSDPTQWVNLVVAYDSTQTTAGDRVKIYINGVEETSFGTSNDPAEDQDTPINNTVLQQIGRRGYSDDRHLDAYMAETVMIDGTRLDASSFGEVDSTTNRWIPKDVSGLTFGTNGYYLDYADENDLGDDESGNANDYAESGFDTTNGSNQFYDTPTDNFAVMGSLQNTTAVPGAGRLSITSTLAGYFAILGSIPMYDGTGKWVWECRLEPEDANPYGMWGVCNVDAVLTGTGFTGSFTTWAGYNAGNGEVTNITPAPTEPAINDIVRFEYDSDTRQIAIINVTSTGAGYQVAKQSIQIEGNPIYPFVAPYGPSLRARFPMNFGQQNYVFGAATTLDSDAGGYFNSTPTSGYKALKADNLTESASFQSAFSWIKNRDATDAYMLFDRVRGPFSFWNSNDDADIADDVDTLQRFLKQGATIGDDDRVNTFNESYVYWDWFIETTGSGTGNGDGSINTALTLVDTTSGVSISKFEGTGANATVGHGLGVAPKFVILKHFDNSGYSTVAWHNRVDTPTTGYLVLDGLDAEQNSAAQWNSTIPTSSVVSLGSSASTNNSGTDYMMYCFAEIEGFSKFGRYEGNANADGPVIYTGFKPAWILVKSLDSTSNWSLYNAAMSPFNPINFYMATDSNAAQVTRTDMDILSNGFKLRVQTGDPNVAESWIFAAFASSPFGGASTTPTTAY